ncbi:MAG: DUF2059 domain-containing protein [Candidatus Omnitrophica bacterium]|nr:DUF2059 domain-containing protein [Candidatus Omnitrophota bacterium]
MRAGLSVIVFFLFLTASAARAETIYFKDGRVVAGKVINRGAYDVVIQEGTLPRHYYNDQILRIEEDQPQAVARPPAPASLDASQFPRIAPEKFGLIMELMDASGVRRSMRTNIDQIIAQAPEEKRGQLETVFNIDAIIAQLVPIYDKYYAPDELKEIVAFYKTPAGQKLIEVTPKIMQEALQASVSYFQKTSSP